MKNIMELCDIVRETAFAIHRFHRNGHLEKVYENALAHRLRKAGWDVKQQYPLQVYDEDGTLIGDYYADLFYRRYRLIAGVEGRQGSGRRTRGSVTGLFAFFAHRTRTADELRRFQV